MEAERASAPLRPLGPRSGCLPITLRASSHAAATASGGVTGSSGGFKSSCCCTVGLSAMGSGDIGTSCLGKVGLAVWGGLASSTTTGSCGPVGCALVPSDTICANFQIRLPCAYAILEVGEGRYRPVRSKCCQAWAVQSMQRIWYPHWAIHRQVYVGNRPMFVPPNGQCAEISRSCV